MTKQYNAIAFQINQHERTIKELSTSSSIWVPDRIKQLRDKVKNLKIQLQKIEEGVKSKANVQ